MRLGLYAELQCPDDKPFAEVYDEILRQITHADKAGFDVYSIIEHHYFQNFGISANPLATLSAAAQRTQQIRFRTALHTLPFHHPLKLAGETATADILTGGRLECGVGRGHAWLCRPMGVPLEESRPRFDEALEILIRAWTEERFSHHGEFWQFEDVAVVPKPVQKPHPPLFTGGTSDITYQTAGERGWGIFVPPLLPYSALERQIGIYKEACAKAGNEPNLVFLRPVYLGDDDAQIRREVEDAVHNFLTFNASPIFQKPSLPSKEELEAKGYGFYASGALESLADISYDDIVEGEIGFIGSPQKVVDQIANLREVAGIAEFSLLANFGGIEHEKAIKTQELFATQVMPAFR